MGSPIHYWKRYTSLNTTISPELKPNMIKIERIDSATRPTYVRNGLRQPLFASQIVSEEEFTTIKLTEGGILYSVNESEVNTLQPNTSDVVSTNSTVISTNPTTINTDLIVVSTNPIVVSTNPIVASTNSTEVSTKPAIVPATPKIVQPKKSGK